MRDTTVVSQILNRNKIKIEWLNAARKEVIMYQNICGGKISADSNGDLHTIETFDMQKSLEVRENWESLKQSLLSQKEPLKPERIFELAVMDRLDTIVNYLKPVTIQNGNYQSGNYIKGTIAPAVREALKEVLSEESRVKTVRP